MSRVECSLILNLKMEWYIGWRKSKNMPDRIIGANKVSLDIAKKKYKLFGATEERFIHMVRQPYENEI